MRPSWPPLGGLALSGAAVEGRGSRVGLNRARLALVGEKNEGRVGLVRTAMRDGLARTGVAGASVEWGMGRAEVEDVLRRLDAESSIRLAVYRSCEGR